MSLREQAAADLQAFVEDAAGGFGWPITLTSPSGESYELTGLSTDIGQTIDPQTGMAVVGRQGSVALPTRRLQALGVDLPRGIADSGSKPWTVRFDDIGGSSHLYKVSEALPDRAVGLVTCLLEVYRG